MIRKYSTLILLSLARTFQHHYNHHHLYHGEYLPLQVVVQGGQAEVGEEDEQQAKLEEQFRKVCRPYRHVVVRMCQVLLENNSLSVLDPHSTMHSGE